MTADLTIKSDYALVSAPLRLSSLLAGEALLACSPCYIKSDGLVWMSITVLDTTVAEFAGMNLDAKAAGDPVTLFQAGAVINCVDGTLTIGNVFYPSATAGMISDADVGGTAVNPPILKAVTANELQVIRQNIP